MALPAAMVLSGLKEEHFSEGLCDVFNQGSLLLKSPSSSSVASTETAYSLESGISSMSSETSVARNLRPYFDLLCESKVEIQAVEGTTIKKQEMKKEIIHENRNILDLASNIKWSGWQLQPAKIKNGIQYFFENRSQYSRIMDAQIPEHIVFYCPYPDCSFGDLIYVT